MSLDEQAGGIAALKALKDYTAKLDEMYGDKALRYFKKVDMRPLADKEAN